MIKVSYVKGDETYTYNALSLLLELNIQRKSKLYRSGVLPGTQIYITEKDYMTLFYMVDRFLSSAEDY